MLEQPTPPPAGGDDSQQGQTPPTGVPGDGAAMTPPPTVAPQPVPVDQVKLAPSVAGSNLGDPTTEEKVVDTASDADAEAKLVVGSGDGGEKSPPSSASAVDAPLAPKQSVGFSAVLRWVLIFGGVLLVVFYVLLLWGLLSGDVSNPLFQTLGVQAGALKDTLILLTNSVFGTFALILLIATLVKFFQWLILGKDAANRQAYLVKAGVYLAMFLVNAALWTGMFWVITRANADGPRNANQSFIITEPVNVVGLTSPQVVEFDIGQNLYKEIDASLIRQINWDFDGDGTIDASGPQVTYRFVDKGANNGRYPVLVDVIYFSPGTEEEKTFQVSREVIITNEAVSADFIADPPTGPLPLKVDFSAEQSYDPDGQIVLYEWDFNNDGQYEIGGEDQVRFTHTFGTAGEQTVRLRVTGSNNDVAEVEKKILVRGAEENLRAEIIVKEGTQGVAPFSLTLDGSQSFVRQGKIVRYEWFIQGEEKVFVGRTAQRTFRKPGEYRVTLTVENEAGQRHKTTEVIKVYESNRNANIVVRTTPGPDQEGLVKGTVPFELTFDSSLSRIANPVDWQWDFENDGIVDKRGPAVKHLYRVPGEYVAKLTIVDAAGNRYEGLQRVVVSRAGTQAKIIADQLSGTVPLTVSFDGSPSTTDEGQIVDYLWEFPGQQPVNYGAQIAYEFKSIGVFPVRLTVLTSGGETDTTTVLISVRAQPLKAEFSAIPDPSDPFTFEFDPAPSQGTVFEYFWDFGDGDTSRDFLPRHTYTFPGEYTVKLKVTDAKGVISEIEHVVKVGS